MADDDRDLLEVLQNELIFLENDGYKCRPSWRPAEIFRDSPSCVNFGELNRIHPCSECVLWDLVPENRRSQPFPCHYIALDLAGHTVASLEPWYSQIEIEDKVREWLKNSIAALEQVRGLTGINTVERQPNEAA